MSLSDPIADMLTRIRNAACVGKDKVNIKKSNLCKSIAQVLLDEGYILDYDIIDDSTQGMLRIGLKYDRIGRSAITDITRTSKPGCRIYKAVNELPRVLGALGIAIVSTSKGVMSDRKCREANVGGEVLCTVS